MAAIDFPSSPVDNQTYLAGNGVTYRYSSSPGIWKAVSSATDTIFSGPTPPASPTANQLWFNTDAATGGGQLYIYYTDINSSAWVPAAAATNLTSPGGDFCASNTAQFTPSTSGAAVGGVLTTIISGNTGNYFNSATGRWTPPAGRYVVWVLASFRTNSSAALGYCGVMKNGVLLSPVAQMTTAGATYTGFGSSQITLDANGGDYFEMYAFGQTGGGNVILALSALFGAFPISGVKGPPGDPYPGTVGGDFYAIHSGADFSLPSTYILLPLTTMVTGNSGGWYGLGTTSRFVPPAGRYRIYAGVNFYGPGANCAGVMEIRKNGVLVGSGGAQTTQPSAGSASDIGVQGTFDANGTDYFEIWAKTNQSGNGRWSYFGAFPISGVKGPPGDPGPDSHLLQTVSTQTGAVATGTGVIPFDDTIPQIGEGTQFMTLAITPRSTTSKLIITVNAAVSVSVAAAVTGTLFRDSTANALAAMYKIQIDIGGYNNLTFTHTMTSGTTSAITFSFRAGGDTASTTTFNGNGGARIYGGVMASSIVIQEVQ